MKLSAKEIQSVSKLSPINRYKYFIKKIVDFEKIYSLKNREGEWEITETDDHHLFSVWPAAEYALQCAINEWSDCTVHEITISEFRNKIAILIIERSLLINVFSREAKTGFVVNLQEFIRDINEENKKYE